MAAELDRSRSYGIISGDTEGRAFEQDDQFFMADGSLWGSGAKPAPAKKKPADQVEAQLEQPA